MGDEIYHHGIMGMKWGIRRYQNADGTLTDAGKKRYGSNLSEQESKYKLSKNLQEDYRKSSIRWARAGLSTSGTAIAIGTGLSIAGSTAVTPVLIAGAAVALPTMSKSAIQYGRSVVQGHEATNVRRIINRSQKMTRKQSKNK